MRRLLISLVLALHASAAAVPAELPTIVVEDWSRQPQGRTGIPEGWQGHSWGSPKYDFMIAAEGSDRVLRLRSRGDNSTISKETRIDVTKSPLMVWRWKVVTLPAGADCRRKATDDEAAQVYVTFPRSPKAFRSRIIGYVWDTTAPAGTIVRSESSGLVTYVVLRSGPAELGRWLTETRNIYDDYKHIYGEAPGEELGAVSVAIDSNDTRSSAESYIGAIVFRKP
jgi:hypothetical protein